MCGKLCVSHDWVAVRARGRGEWFSNGERERELMQDLMATAIRMHQSGQLGPAAQIYQRLLAMDRNNAEALHMLGVLNHQRGDHRSAVNLIGRAVAIVPNAFNYHANMAEAYRALGEFDRAIGCCKAALGVRPKFPEALCNLGSALQGLKRHGEAVAEFARALELRPEFVVAHNNVGISLRELGRHQEALEHFERAVALEPGYGHARTNLGQALIEHGRAAEALPHCLEAVKLFPNAAEPHHNLANAYRVLGRWEEARTEYLETLRLAPDQALTNAHLGLVLKAEDKLGQAISWLRNAIDLEPGNADYWRWMGELYEEMDESEPAIPVWQALVALKPDDVPGRLSLGRALQDEGRFDEAREQYETVLAIQPDAAAARMNLGWLHEEVGELAEAEADYRAARLMQPDFPLPLARLGTLLRGKLDDPELAAIEDRLTDEKLGENPRGRLLFALAHVLDARGDYARAAECLVQSNAISLKSGRRPDYDPTDHEQFVDSLTAVFTREFLESSAGQGSDSRRPIFIFGLPRSGTTLTEQVLASHSRIHGAGELRLGRKSFEAVPRVLGVDEAPIHCVSQVDALVLNRIAEMHLTALAEHDQGAAARVVDKMPENYVNFGFLTLLFPNALFIHCKRDPRDVAVSCWMTDFAKIPWAFHPDHIASRFVQYRRLMDHWREVLPGRMLEIDYEETVVDLESVARRMIAAAGLEWEPACLEFHRTERPVRTASVTQVRQPVYQRSVARWKNYEPALKDLFAALEAAEPAATGAAARGTA